MVRPLLFVFSNAPGSYDRPTSTRYGFRLVQNCNIQQRAGPHSGRSKFRKQVFVSTLAKTRA